MESSWSFKIIVDLGETAVLGLRRGCYKSLGAKPRFIKSRADVPRYFDLAAR